MKLTIQQKKENKSFLLAMFGFILLLAFLFYDEKVNDMNTTMLAFSYKYGFISRGFVGSIFQFLVDALPGMTLNYSAVMNFTKCVTAIFFLCILFFFGSCQKIICAQEHSTTSTLHYAHYFMILYTVFAVPFSVTNYNFGRTDIWLAFISIICVLCIIRETFAWVVIPLCAIAIMIHQGFAFMFMNTIMILLLYKIIGCTGKKRRNFILILAICILSSATLFLWFELFSHSNGEHVYDQIMHTATEIARSSGKVHIDVIDKEILGIDLTDREIELHLQNLVQFPIFILLMLPYIIYAYQFFSSIIKNSANTLEKAKYFAIAIGSLTIVPLLILKVDFGRWMFAIIHYYLIILLALISMNDKQVIKYLHTTIEKIKQKKSITLILLVYPIILQPLRDVSICKLTAKIGGVINELWLHWW